MTSDSFSAPPRLTPSRTLQDQHLLPRILCSFRASVSCDFMQLAFTGGRGGFRNHSPWIQWRNPRKIHENCCNQWDKHIKRIKWASSTVIFDSTISIKSQEVNPNYCILLLCHSEVAVANSMCHSSFPSYFLFLRSFCMITAQKQTYTGILNSIPQEPPLQGISASDCFGWFRASQLQLNRPFCPLKSQESMQEFDGETRETMCPETMYAWIIMNHL